MSVFPLFPERKVSTVKIFHNNELNNQELERLAEETTELLKLSAVQALAATVNPDVYKADFTKPSGTDAAQSFPSVAEVVAERFQQYSPDKQYIIGLDLGRDQEITQQIHRLGIDMRAEESVLDQVEISRRFSFLSKEWFDDENIKKMASGLGTPTSPASAEEVQQELNELKERYHGIIPPERLDALISGLNDSSAAGPEAARLNRQLRFRVHEVKCVDETNPEWPGGDEISMGGAAAGDTGVATEIRELFVGGGFDDGDRKTYAPPLVLQQFDMLAGNFPKTYIVTLTLAEKDNGGMSEFIRKLWEAIKGKVTEILNALAAAAGAAIGGKIGGSIGTAIAGPLGTIIGAVAGAIIGALVAWLVNALKDDIFPPQASSAFFYAPDGTFPGGSLTSPRDSLHFRDHGGHYQVTYDWQIVR